MNYLKLLIIEMIEEITEDFKTFITIFTVEVR